MLHGYLGNREGWLRALQVAALGRRGLFTAVCFVAACLIGISNAAAKTIYVAKTGSDKGNCQTENAPCATIEHGISLMVGGDTLIVGDGTYAEQITRMPSGSAGAYTTIRAANDWGVTIDGSGFADNYLDGIRVSTNYVAIRGFHVKMNQAKTTNSGVNVFDCHHVKIQRCSVAYAGTSDNVSAFNVGPACDYVLLEEGYVYGGARYPFLVYQSTHTVVRRNVSRLDYWNGSLQAANFTNYNGDMTVWQNNIAIDSDTKNIGGSGLYGGFFNENKVPDSSWSGTATRETYRGNIVLNVQASFSGMYDYDVSNLHTYSDNIIWDSHGGYYGDYVHGDAPKLDATRFTIGKIRGDYSSPNGQGSAGSGFYIGPGTDRVRVSNMLTNSILWNNPFYGIADYGVGDYNSLWNNGKGNYGGEQATPSRGAHDLTSDFSADLKYLPRIESGSKLATAGSEGGPIGASVLYMWGATGTLWGDPDYDTITSEPLWPFPNEDIIKTDMASYSGPGGVGSRGFTKGNSLDGTPQTLTKYIWEYLGNPIPADVYGFRIGVGTLPSGVVGSPYRAQATASGGTAPYKFAATGSLPPGLSIDESTGIISGTPTAAGSSRFTLTATDSSPSPQKASRELSIVITAAIQPPDAGIGTGDAGSRTDAGDGAGGRGGAGGRSGTGGRGGAGGRGSTSLAPASGGTPAAGGANMGGVAGSGGIPAGGAPGGAVGGDAVGTGGVVTGGIGAGGASVGNALTGGTSKGCGCRVGGASARVPAIGIGLLLALLLRRRR